MVRAIIFDFGNTLIQQRIDAVHTLDKMDLALLPGATQTLERLRSHYKLGLLSNTVHSTAHHVSRALDKLGLRGLFDVVVTSVDCGVEKPDPRIFYHILNCLNVQASEAVMVGNDIEQDVAGAKSVGMRTVFFSLEPQDWRRKASSPIVPDYEISALVDLVLIMEVIKAGEVKQPALPPPSSTIAQ